MMGEVEIGSHVSAILLSLNDLLKQKKFRIQNICDAHLNGEVF